MTRPIALHLGELLLARVLPGVLNLLTFVWIGRALTLADYGQFSLVLATITLAVSLSIGPIEHAILPLHATQAQQGRARAFESQVFGAALILVAFCAAPALGLFALGLLHPGWILLFAASALLGVALALMRARLDLLRYGVAASAKSASALGLVAILLPVTPNPATALTLYATAVLLGACVAWALLGCPCPRLPSRAFLAQALPLGAGLTLATLAESLLLVGTRYALALFGTPQLLGVFSLALDLAQRSVGVVINLASFALIPRAYAALAKGDTRQFRTTLTQGALVSGGLALALLALVLLLDHMGAWARHLGAGLDPLVFVAVSGAVIVNRLKKLSLDPALVQAGRVMAIPFAYLITAPPALSAMIWLLRIDRVVLIFALYPLAYLTVAALTAAALWRTAVHKQALR